MKKVFYIIPLVGMLMASCASEEPGIKGNGTPGEGSNSYLTINIQQTSGFGTRADGDNVIDDETYRNGTQSEQQVNSIRFFFFDGAGEGAPVSILSQDGDNITYCSYIDWIHNDSNLGAGIPGETVEATVSATLGLFIPDDATVPQSMIAIVNPSQAVKNITNTGTGEYGPTMSDVQTAVANFESGLTDGNFVMSNSVYAVESAEDQMTTVNYTSLIPGTGKAPYFQSSVEAAQANPVTIWVERVAARLDLSINLTNISQDAIISLPDGRILYPVMKKVASGTEGTTQNDIQATVNGEGVYVTFLGWNVTSTPDQSFLVKMINPAWTSKGLFGDESTTRWNTADYHRCFWAMNPSMTEDNYQYGSFLKTSENTKNLQPANALDIPAAGKYTTTYMQENASEYNFPGLAASAPLKPTQVIIAAQLVYEDGEPVELAEWGYEKYTQEDLLTYLATNIISQGNFWKETTTGYSKLTAEDLCFVSARTKYPGELPNNVKEYYSYVELNTDASKAKWFIQNTDGDQTTYTETAVSTINQYILNSVGYTMMWNNGYTYYYFDVHHLGLPGSYGYNGIVRNHLYEAIVKTLYGYGTPVPNPEEIIIPQTPEYEEILLAAQIRILEWRVIRTEYDLEWK